ncbi:hypothetical protein [Virgibacillus sp. DJP39]|uniref:hypothetical protein n=1 Tax=Virgibacillus sp. DJP39 TaxID=3409790 RepID=UPI003BB7F47D
MLWLYTIVAIVILTVLLVAYIVSNKRKKPNENSSLSVEEKEVLQKDYISHGSHNDEDDNKKL